MLQNGADINAALDFAQIARQKIPASPSAADILAWAYYQKGLYGFAADLLHAALAKAPNNATYHYHLDIVYKKQKNRKRLQRALRINPKSPAAGAIRKTLNQIG